MSRVSWKDKKVVSIKLRDGVYVLAQLLKSPYLIIFNLYSSDDNWHGETLSDSEVLFFHAVTRHFLKHTEVNYQKTVSPLKLPKCPTQWIKRNPGAYHAKIWEGTENEMSLLMLGKGGGSLIERDIYGNASTGERVIERELASDSSLIDSCEMTGLGIYPSFNERLHLCYEMGRNVDPEKELIFGRPLDLCYKRYFQIISGQVKVTELGYFAGN